MQRQRRLFPDKQGNPCLSTCTGPLDNGESSQLDRAPHVEEDERGPKVIVHYALGVEVADRLQEEPGVRSEERRGGKEWRSRWSGYH